MAVEMSNPPMGQCCPLCTADEGQLVLLGLLLARQELKVVKLTTAFLKWTLGLHEGVMP